MGHGKSNMLVGLFQNLRLLKRMRKLLYMVIGAKAVSVLGLRVISGKDRVYIEARGAREAF